MDDIYHRAQELERALEHFNEQVRSGIDEVKRAHANVAPLWNDSMRAEYERTWSPLEESMDHYIRKTGPEYVEVLLTRLQALRTYLHGS